MLSEKFLNIISNEYVEISTLSDESGIQEACSIRNVLVTRELSELLIDDNGKLLIEFLPKAVSLFKEKLYSIAPRRIHDIKRREHILNVLVQLNDNKKVRIALQRVGKPHMHRFADDIIRNTLQLPAKTVITDAHARRSVLSAWLCFLRQNVGSCFATAPAILVHDEQPELLLNDLSELLSTGRLKRTFSGNEYSVPLSSSWGAGDLKRVINASQHEVQKSPGLQAAFESIELPLEECSGYVTAESIIKKALLDKFELSEKDLEEYELRPKGVIHGSFLMQSSVSEGGVGERCSHFLRELEIAFNVFKSFADNALLKSWEFSLASFAETKAQFASWNLYSSLGLGPQDEGGIGLCLYEILKQKLDESNQQAQEHQLEYEQLLSQVQFLQRRVQRADSEKSAQWARAEYQSKANEFRMQEELRNKAHFKAQRYAHLFDDLVNIYYKLFPKYFQEVYDADIHQVTTGPYDDSPAGFHLVYKHGRSNTSQWTKIENHVEFIDALVSFFTATEVEIAGSEEMQGLEDDISAIVSAIVSHIRTDEFLETAFYRMAKVHNVSAIKDPLENLDKIEKKPWVYTSGGAMTTLVSNYFKRDEKPTDVSRWVEDPMELLVFCLDTLKQIPGNLEDEIGQNSERSILAHSPTHAFSLKPGYSPFDQGWKNKEFTYTWVRDNWVQKMETALDVMYLDEDKMQYLIKKIHRKVPQNYKPYFSEVFGGLRGSMKVRDFRQHIVDAMDVTRGLRDRGSPIISSEVIDSILFESLPIIPGYQLRERVEVIISKLPGIDQSQQKKMLGLLDKQSSKIGTVIGSKELQEKVLELIRLALEKTTVSHNYIKIIANSARKQGFALPPPIIFADTNWTKDYFAFLVNPGTNQLEFWRCDPYGITGSPMRIWDEWLNGTRKTPKWGVYINLHEYLS